MRLKRAVSSPENFVERNLDQAKRLGAKRIAIFCSPCYERAAKNIPKEKQTEILMLPELVERMLSIRSSSGSGMNFNSFRVIKEGAGIEKSGN